MKLARNAITRRRGASLVALATATVLLTVATQASAAIVPTVPLLTSANYSVLGSTQVTNTGSSVLAESVGVSPGTLISGFPPGSVTPPGTTDSANGASGQARADLTAAYLDAAGRPLDATVAADLSALTLAGGVYAAASNAPLSLTGTLTLDGAGDPTTVFIFQTGSTLITGSASSVTLINGAQECNVFWQVGSSATLGTGSTFVGNIMALTSISVTTGVTVHGRALARNGEVTLDSDVFTSPTCNLSAPAPTTTTVAPSATTTPTTVPVVLPRTGRSVGTNVALAIGALAIGVVAIKAARRKPVPSR